MSENKHQFMIHYPPGFRQRRGLNWFSLGLMYATYYMCRYNFRFATPGMSEEFGFDSTDIANLFAVWSLAYGTGQLINGLFSDRIGGKRSMLIGAVATIIVNFILGFSPLVSTFTTFAMLALLNGYFQSFGAPGMIKINAAWFHRTERGVFAGIFGIMIQLGQVAISRLGPYMLSSGIVIFGITMAKQGEWRALFQIPPLFTACAAILMFFAVKESPEAAGYPDDVVVDEIDDSEGVTVSLGKSFKTILTHPLVWFYAVAYACTGAVRQPTDQLAPMYFQDQLGFDMANDPPAMAVWTLVAMPIVAVLGSIASGIISDKLLSGKRAPVAVVLYFFEAAVIATAAVIMWKGLVNPTGTGVFIGCAILIMISMTVNSTHSLVGAAAPMDIGGKKMAGFAAGVIDSFQYYGAAFALFVTGMVQRRVPEEDKWLYWLGIMACFGAIGGVSMFLLMLKQRRMRREGRIVAG